MVQSALLSCVSSHPTSKDWHMSQPSGHKIQEKKKEDPPKKNVDSKYGAWGSTFKNKNHFASLHHC